MKKIAALFLFATIAGFASPAVAKPILWPCWYKFCFSNGKPSTGCLQCPQKPDCCNQKAPPPIS